jgi:lipid II:glycine glycyltransferase (peptidoglycan interpeptide bridge formation enzyme)
MEVLIQKEVDSLDWDKNLLKSEFSTVYQTSLYAEYLKTINYVPYYLTVKEGNDVLGQLLFFKYSIFLNSVNNKIINKWLINLLPSIRWIYAPIVFYKEEENKITDLILNEIMKFAVQNRLDIDKFNLHPLQKKSPLIDKYFSKKEWSTFIIDLAQAKEKLWSNIDSSAREKIKKAQKEGVVIEEVTDEQGFKEYFKVLCENRNRNGVKVLKYDSSFYNLLIHPGLMKHFNARLGDKTIAGMTISVYNGYLNQWGTALSDFAIQKRIPAGDLVKWHVIEFGQKEEYKYYDMTGVNPNPQPGSKDEGLYKFKQKWGGLLVENNLYSRHLNLWTKKFLFLVVNNVKKFK